MHSVGESGANVPAFLAKLWKIVEDPALDDLISWNSSGLSFTIRDQARFARELLPLYYKHNNMASFVRQLNMYGFHKVVSLDSGGLKLDKDEMEFAHTYFIRGHECLLEHIKRKIPVSKQDDSKVKPEVLSKVLSDVRAMRGKQETLDSRLATMKRENEALWREVATLRQKHLKQQQIVNKLIHFLISIVQPNGRSGISLKRRVPLMLQAEAFSASPDSKNSKKQQRVLNINAAKGLDKSAPIIANISPGGPIIHDVTDLIDDIGEDGVVEVSVGQEITLETVPQEEETPAVEIPEPANEVDVQIPSELLSEQPTLEILPHERDDSQPTGLDDGQPDLSLIAQLQENDNSAMLASPLSPELLLAVNPSEIVGKRSPAVDCITLSSSSDVVISGKFGGEPVKDKDSKKVNGKSSEKETEMRLAVIDNGQNSLGSRNELDNHLDTIQMDLENLREILSLQPGSVDPTTLLGLLTVGSDESRLRCTSPAEVNFTTLLLDHHFSSKLFSADEPNIFLNGVSEIQRPMSSTSRNELISYNPSLFELTSDDGQFLPDDANLLATGLVEEDDPNEDKTDGLLNLLGFTDGPSPAKKTKSS